MTCRVVPPDGTVYVTELGVGSSWYSDDTRNANGTVLNGLVSSYPGFFFGFPGTAADDVEIQPLLTFTSAPPYDTSTNGNGVLRLWATDVDKGKASVRFYMPYQGINTAPVANGSVLDTIEVKFRYYMQPDPSSRTPSFNLLVVGPTIGIPSFVTSYSLSWVGEPPDNVNQQNAWNEFSMNSTTRGWRIFCTILLNPDVCPGGDGDPFTMEELLANSTFGPVLSTGSIFGVGFNLGSDQRQAFIGIDWLETSLLNGGNRIDFADPAAFPTVTMGGATVGGSLPESGVTSTPPAGWTWGIGTASEPAQVMAMQFLRSMNLKP